MTTDKINPEYPAYPWGEDYPGMDLRTYLAAIALQGLLANPSLEFPANSDVFSEFSKLAVRYSDQLIDELNK